MFADEQYLFTPWFRLICRDLLFPWWDEMLVKSRAEGWNPEEGKGVVRAGVLENGDKVNDLLKME
jgi:isopentenyl-diphosphate delta-isomerase